MGVEKGQVHAMPRAGWFAWIGLAVCLSMSGCATVPRVPAHSVSCGPVRNGLAPIDFTLLGQPIPPEHIVGPGDVLGLYIEDVIGTRGLLPPVDYPDPDPASPIERPAVGQPVQVHSDGRVAIHAALPLIYVAGFTLPKAAEILRQVCIDAKLLVPQRSLVTVTLIRPRTFHVTVIREDTMSGNIGLIRRDTQVISKRGSAEVLELPAFQNDVLHALTLSGGLPGTDSPNMVCVIRRKVFKAGWPSTPPQELLYGRHILCIPLRLPPGAPLPCAPQDVILHDGDIVFIGAREADYFISGGLLPGGQVPLPRDHDVDVLTAVAMANGNLIGPSASSSNFVRGVGNVVPPTRVEITRRISPDKQIVIDVDLRRAMHDPRERVLIQPGDIVLLKYRPSELAANLALNLVNFNYSIPNN